MPQAKAAKDGTTYYAYKMKQSLKHPMTDPKIKIVIYVKKLTRKARIFVKCVMCAKGT